MKRLSVLLASLVLVLGMTGSALAATLATGTYDFNIIETPFETTNFGGTVFTLTNRTVGVDGDWNSSFTFGNSPNNSTSNPMVDNSKLANGLGDGNGSGVNNPAPDGWAGVINVTVDAGGVFTINSYQVDVIDATAGGDFAQWGDDLSLMTGNIDASGVINFTPTSRQGSIDGGAGLVTDFNSLDSDVSGSTAWHSFTSGTTTYGQAGNITGSALVDDGDGTWTAVLVSGGSIGTSWGPGFAGQTYYETLRFDIRTASAPIPEPGSLLLIGSGLVGLLGLARGRRNK